MAWIIKTNNSQFPLSHLNKNWPAVYIISEKLERPVFVSVAMGHLEMTSVDDTIDSQGVIIDSLAEELGIPIIEYQKVQIVAEVIEYTLDKYTQIFHVRGYKEGHWKVIVSPLGDRFLESPEDGIVIAEF